MAFLIAIFSVCSWSQDSNETFFEIHFEKDSVRVDAEFPFTLRQAMFQDLDQDSNAYFNYFGKKEFEYHEIMDFYFRKNLFLVDKSGDTSFIQNYRVIKTEESNNPQYKFIFLRTSRKLTMHNSLLKRDLQFNEKNINKHTVWKGGKKFEFETKMGATSFLLPSSSKEEAKTSSKPNYLPWVTFGACALLFGAGLFYRIKRKSLKK